MEEEEDNVEVDEKEQEEAMEEEGRAGDMMTEER